MSEVSAVSSGLARADFAPRADWKLLVYEHYDSPDII
jgi:hypothetical protein